MVIQTDVYSNKELCVSEAASEHRWNGWRRFHRRACADFRSANTQLKRQSCWGHTNQCSVTRGCNKRVMEWCLQEAAVLLGHTVTLLCHKNGFISTTAQVCSFKTKLLKMSHIQMLLSYNGEIFLANSVLWVHHANVIFVTHRFLFTHYFLTLSWDYISDRFYQAFSSTPTICDWEHIARFG